MHGVSDTEPNFWVKAFVTMLLLVALVGFVAWQMRRDKKTFRVLRVLTVTFALLLFGSLPFAAAYWWLASRGNDRNNPYLLAAAFFPIAVLELWGLIFGIRRNRKKPD